MQDNAKPHTAGNTRNFLQERGIQVMEWPALSPEVIPLTQHGHQGQGRPQLCGPNAIVKGARGTIVPGVTFSLTVCHFTRCCNEFKYAVLQRFQNNWRIFWI
jgi:hypothetical protein